VQQDDLLLRTFLTELPALSRLFRRATGSDLTAEDLSQDAWLRLASTQAAELKNPAAYLRRISSNLAVDFARRRSLRQLTVAEVDDILEMPDPTPGPEETLVAKDAMRNLMNALADLPERRRAILIAARLERVPHAKIAEYYGISTRTVEIELRKAIEHCARVLLDF
jgi:RNA polymerase sigma-70 factor (ECF subfamily)